MLNFIKNFFKSKPKTYTVRVIPNLSRKIRYRAEKKYQAVCLLQYGIGGGEEMFLQIKDDIIRVQAEMFPFPGFDNEDKIYKKVQEISDFGKAMSIIINTMNSRNQCKFINKSFYDHVINVLDEPQYSTVKSDFDYEYWHSALET